MLTQSKKQRKIPFYDFLSRVKYKATFSPYRIVFRSATSLRGRRWKGKGKGDLARAQIPPSPSPFNAGHAGYSATKTFQV